MSDDNATLLKGVGVPLSEYNWTEYGVFTSESVFNELLILYVVATFGFGLAYYLNKWYYPALMMMVFGKESPYFKLDEKNLREYHSRNVADFHSAIAAPLSTISLFYCCDDKTKDIFSSQDCLMKP